MDLIPSYGYAIIAIAATWASFFAWYKTYQEGKRCNKALDHTEENIKIAEGLLKEARQLRMEADRLHIEAQILRAKAFGEMEG